LSNVPANLPVRLAALLHDVGKPSTRKTVYRALEGILEAPVDTFYGHEEASACIAVGVLRRLRFPTEMVQRVSRLCALHMRPMQLYNDWPPSTKAIRRLVHAAGDDLTSLLALNYADILGKGTATEEDTDKHVVLVRLTIQEYLNTDVVEATSPLDGNELVEAYFGTPGPVVGRWKKRLTDAVVDGIIAEGDKEAAHDYLQREGLIRVDTLGF
jgi:poly(A) polymerase